MDVTYTAQRSLNTVVSPSHTADTEYTFTLALKNYDRKRKSYKKVATSLSGVEQHTYQRGETSWACKTIPLSGADAASMREFLDSVEDGTPFVITDGGVDISCRLKSTSYSEQRAGKLGGGGDSDYFVFGWSHREE